MIQQKQASKDNKRLDKLQKLQNEIFTQNELQFDEKGQQIVQKLNYSRLNEFFTIILLMRTRSLYLGISVIVIINVIASLLFYFLSAKQFVIAFYYLPISVFLLIAWAQINKSQLQIKKQIYLNIISFLFFGVVFFTCYFMIYHHIIGQEFTEASECFLEKQAFQDINGTINEKYTLLTISFIDKDGNNKIGCGCLSSRYEDNVISGFPYPYSYIDDSLEINSSFKYERYNLSQLKSPSWFCASTLDSISATNINDNTKTQLKHCFYNYFLGNNDDNNNNINICTESKEYPQIIFNEIPFYDKAFLHVLIAFFYEFLFAYSLQWPAIMLSYILLRLIRKRKSRSIHANNQQNFSFMQQKNSMQIIPEEHFQAYLKMINQSYSSQNQKGSQNQISNLDLSILNQSIISHQTSKALREEQNKLVQNGKKIKLESIDQNSLQLAQNVLEKQKQLSSPKSPLKHNSPVKNQNIKIRK